MKKYENLTKHLPALTNDNYGGWVFNEKNNDGNSKQMPFVEYSKAVLQFIEDYSQFQKETEYYDYKNFREILQENQIAWSQNAMCNADISKMNARGILALITGAIQAGRFCEGGLLVFFKKGVMQKWLLRLNELDEE